MREERHRDVRTYSFLVAQQKHFFKAGKIPGIDGKDYLVNHLTLQQVGQRRNGEDGVRVVQRQSLAGLSRAS